LPTAVDLVFDDRVATALDQQPASSKTAAGSSCAFARCRRRRPAVELGDGLGDLLQLRQSACSAPRTFVVEQLFARQRAVLADSALSSKAFSSGVM
jgi:hypothetical protein